MQPYMNHVQEEARKTTLGYGVKLPSSPVASALCGVDGGGWVAGVRNGKSGVQSPFGWFGWLGMGMDRSNRSMDRICGSIDGSNRWIDPFTHMVTPPHRLVDRIRMDGTRLGCCCC
jgi:hypothetical protein